MASCEGQFEDADSSSHAYTKGPPSPEESEGSEERSGESEDEYWGAEYGDWHGETGDFTKKLNAARSGQAGANSQQGKGVVDKADSSITQKAIHVSCGVVL